MVYDTEFQLDDLNFPTDEDDEAEADANSAEVRDFSNFAKHPSPPSVHRICPSPYPSTISSCRGSCACFACLRSSKWVPWAGRSNCCKGWRAGKVRQFGSERNHRDRIGVCCLSFCARTIQLCCSLKFPRRGHLSCDARHVHQPGVHCHHHVSDRR